MNELTLLESHVCFDGLQNVYSHQSKTVACVMRFAVFIPPVAVKKKHKVGVIYFLAGASSCERDFIVKSGFQRYAAQQNLCVICSDTSPRDTGIDYDETYPYAGENSSFYIDATTEKWKKHFQMFTYVTEELIEVAERNFDFIKIGCRSIMGHSMGGHGALICSMKKPGLFKSVSAFAPVCNMSASSLLRKALIEYVGTDEETWKNWDATCLLEEYEGPSLNIMIDQGFNDDFFKDLMPESLVKVALKRKIPLIYTPHEIYDHGYFFVATFVEKHIQHHAKYLAD